MTGPSVLTIVRDRPGHFANLVEGLRRSTMLPGELVAVDMSTVPLEAPSAPFSVTIVRLDTDGLPLAAARNCAVAASRGEQLLFLDVDCIPLADYIATMAAVLAEHDALLCGDVRYLGPDDARGDWTEADLLAAGQLHPVRDFPASGIRREANPGLFWSLSFALRRARFDAIGGFDARFTGYGGEDTDFGFRAAAAGVPLLFVGGAIACHQWHESQEPPLRHLADIVRNANTFHRKHGWWPMEGWLRQFAECGLVHWTQTALTLQASVRTPGSRS